MVFDIFGFSTVSVKNTDVNNCHVTGVGLTNDHLQRESHRSKMGPQLFQTSNSGFPPEVRTVYPTKCHNPKRKPDRFDSKCITVSKKN